MPVPAIEGSATLPDPRSAPADRHDRLAAVLRDRIDTLCSHANDLLTASSADAGLAEWTLLFLNHAKVNQGMDAEMLIEDTDIDCHRLIHDGAAALLECAQRTGTARADLTTDELLQLVAGIALATATDEDETRARRLLDLTLDAVHAAERR